MSGGGTMGGLISLARQSSCGRRQYAGVGGESMAVTNDSRATQILLLRLLLLARGGWVRLHTDSIAHIRKLRHLGFRIPAPHVVMVDGKRHTWYRIELGWASESTQKTLQSRAVAQTALCQPGELERTAKSEDRG